MKREVTCEMVCMAAMASADGTHTPLSPAEVEAHLPHCAECRGEIEQLERLSGLLNSQRRSLRRTEALWTGIENRLPAPAAARATFAAWPTFVLLGLSLVAYRLFEMIPDRSPGWPLKVMPVLLAVAAFVYLRENPFKINAELRLEGE